MAKSINLPLEGDLLFEKKGMPIGHFWGIFFVIMGTSFTVGLTKDVVHGKFTSDDIMLLVVTIFFLLLAISYIILLYFGFKNGFKDETYEGYFFSDKVVFYRISKYVDESYTKKKSKEELLKEIIELKDKISKKKSGDELSLLKWELQSLEKGVKILESKPFKHKSELHLKDVKYFINEKNQIKVVEDYQDDENELTFFYNKLELAKKYEQHKSEVVEFLNRKAKEAKEKAAMEEVDQF